MIRLCFLSWNLAVFVRIVLGEGDEDATVAHLTRSVNVKTVIFTEGDIERACFDTETIQMLLARQVMQSLIPKKLTRDYAALSEFINKAEVILKMRMQENNELLYMKRAFYDAIGGYLHVYIIPIMNEEYYAGNVEYAVANELHSIMKRMKMYLGTNGGAWADPCDMTRIPVKVTPLCVNLHKRDESCENFVLSDDLLPDSEEGEPNRGTTKLPDCGPDKPRIQLPFLDDNAMPSAIVLPIRERSLFSLMTSCSVDIVPKYYVMAMRCLSNPQFTDSDRSFFNQKLYEWIMVTVLPHLRNDERFYVGFGAVMKVVETINQGGLTDSTSYKTGMKTQNGSNFMTADIDDKWYSTYVIKFGGGQILILVAAGFLVLSVVVIIGFIIARTCFGGGGDKEIKCYEDVEEDHCYEDEEEVADEYDPTPSGQGEFTESHNETPNESPNESQNESQNESGTSASYASEVVTQCRSSGTSGYLGVGSSDVCVSPGLVKPSQPTSSSSFN